MGERLAPRIQFVMASVNLLAASFSMHAIITLNVSPPALRGVFSRQEIPAIRCCLPLPAPLPRPLPALGFAFGNLGFMVRCYTLLDYQSFTQLRPGLATFRYNEQVVATTLKTTRYNHSFDQ